MTGKKLTAITTILLIAAGLGVVPTTTAFHIRRSPYDLSISIKEQKRTLTVVTQRGAAESSSSSSSTIQHDQASILEGGSAKAIRLRKQLQEIWNQPNITSPIILSGPRGAGKSELAEEIVYQLPSWQTQTVHRLKLEDGMDFLDTILGTTSHPGLMDDLSGQANTTLVLKAVTTC